VSKFILLIIYKSIKAKVRKNCRYKKKEILFIISYLKFRQIIIGKKYLNKIYIYIYIYSIYSFFNLMILYNNK